MTLFAPLPPHPGVLQDSSISCPAFASDTAANGDRHELHRTDAAGFQKTVAANRQLPDAIQGPPSTAIEVAAEAGRAQAAAETALQRGDVAEARELSRRAAQILRTLLVRVERVGWIADQPGKKGQPDRDGADGGAAKDASASCISSSSATSTVSSPASGLSPPPQRELPQERGRQMRRFCRRSEYRNTSIPMSCRPGVSDGAKTSEKRSQSPSPSRGRVPAPSSGSRDPRPRDSEEAEGITVINSFTGASVQCRRAVGTRVGNDAGSGARNLLNYYEAKGFDDWLMLGHGIGVDMVLVKEGPLVRRATRWTRCWYDFGSGKEKNYAIYIPSCDDPNFVACGVVFVFGVEPHQRLEPRPSMPVAVVHRSVVQRTELQVNVWSDLGSGALFDVELKLVEKMGTTWPVAATLLGNPPPAYELKHVSCEDPPRFGPLSMVIRNTFLEIDDDNSCSPDAPLDRRQRALSWPRRAVEDFAPGQRHEATIVPVPRVFQPQSVRDILGVAAAARVQIEDVTDTGPDEQYEPSICSTGSFVAYGTSVYAAERPASPTARIEDLDDIAVFGAKEESEEEASPACVEEADAQAGRTAMEEDAEEAVAVPVTLSRGVDRADDRDEQATSTWNIYEEFQSNQSNEGGREFHELFCPPVAEDDEEDLGSPQSSGDPVHVVPSTGHNTPMGSPVICTSAPSFITQTADTFTQPPSPKDARAPLHLAPALSACSPFLPPGISQVSPSPICSSLPAHLPLPTAPSAVGKVFFDTEIPARQNSASSSAFGQRQIGRRSVDARATPGLSAAPRPTSPSTISYSSALTRDPVFEGVASTSMQRALGLIGNRPTDSSKHMHFPVSQSLGSGLPISPPQSTSSGIPAPPSALGAPFHFAPTGPGAAPSWRSATPGTSPSPVLPAVSRPVSAGVKTASASSRPGHASGAQPAFPHETGAPTAGGLATSLGTTHPAAIFEHMSLPELMLLGDACTRLVDWAKQAMNVPPGSQAAAAAAGGAGLGVEQLAAALSQVDLGSPALPSVGSAGHATGTCKACAFVVKGCRSGKDCTFCHLCVPTEKKHGRWNLKRRKAADELVRDVNCLQGAQDGSASRGASRGASSRKASVGPHSAGRRSASRAAAAAASAARRRRRMNEAN